ncbi:MAG TPA: class F sortase [Pseudonocardiaceae bacterium]|jgi:hypothetical protein|nr:class F sortase [Pseudonocardiaceae bacterium]
MSHRAPVRGRHGRPVWLAVAATVGLLGIGLLITGALQVIRLNSVAGLPETSADYSIAEHDAGPASQLLAGHAATAHPSSGTTTRRQAAATTPVTTPSSPAQQLPDTIRLPLGGTAYLVHGQVAADGSLPIPAGVGQAIWWGAAINGPGGATVFAGHVNWAGKTGPFAELWQDKVGQIVTVADTDGTVARFQVTQLLTLTKDQLPQQAPILFSPSGPHRIVLATCGGEWVGGQLGYDDNRVMIATPVA